MTFSNIQKVIFKTGSWIRTEQGQPAVKELGEIQGNIPDGKSERIPPAVARGLACGRRWLDAD